jgi:serine/threonine-protein kinase RsbW
VTSSRVEAPITMRLPFSASAVSVARQRLKTWMTDHGEPQEAVEDARVVISELVANSVRHARPLADGSILVSWAPDRDGVHLSVTDGGSQTRPHSVQAPASALAGRGMAIVDILSRRWWTEQTSSRSTVHALLED